MKIPEITGDVGEEQRAETGSPISKLPNEILGIIFMKLKNLRVYKEFDWINILLVSRRWRDVALGHTALWTKIPPFNHTGALYMLQRSGASLLDVTIERDTAKQTVFAVLNHIDRFGRLSIANGVWDTYDFQERLQSAGGAASQLRALEIGSQFDCGLGYDRDDPPQPPLYAKTLQHLVSIQDLSLHGVEYDWDILPIPTLRRLSLTESTPVSPPSWPQFLGALRRMPLLQNIDLSFGDLTLASAGPPQATIIDMLQLRELSMRDGSLSTLGYFISQVNGPALQNANIASNYDSEIEVEISESYERVIFPILSLLGGCGFQPMRCLEINREGFTLRATKPKRRRGWVRKGIHFTCQGILPSTFVRVILDQLTTQLQSRAADIIRLMVHTDTNSQDLSKLVAVLPSLKSIEVSRGYESMLQCLSAPPASPGRAPGPAPILKRLNVGPRRVFDSHQGVELLANHVCDCLIARQRSNLSLRKLTLSGWFTEAHALMFQDLANEVRRRRTKESTYAEWSSPENSDED